MLPQLLGAQGCRAAGGDNSALAALLLLPDRRQAFGHWPAIHFANIITKRLVKGSEFIGPVHELPHFILMQPDGVSVWGSLPSPTCHHETIGASSCPGQCVDS
jgi:hypothetical protein